MKLQIYSMKGEKIESTKEWYEYAPPMRKELHWKDYRSAKELAKSVFDNASLTPKISTVLTRFGFPVPTEMLGYPEKATELPWGKSGDRKHDLLLVAKDMSLVIGIEAKADEPFDNDIKTKRVNSKNNTDGGANMEKRLDGILNFLYKNNPPKEKETLMYQLLSATAGVILEAQKHHINQACMLFLVFESAKLSSTKMEKNEKDWNVFCKSMKIGKNGGIITIEGVECLIVKEQIKLK